MTFPQHNSPKIAVQRVLVFRDGSLPQVLIPKSLLTESEINTVSNRLKTINMRNTI